MAERDCLPYMGPWSIATRKGQKGSRKILEKIREDEENTELVYFETREQQNTRPGIFETMLDSKENTESVHLETRKQQDRSLGILRGRREVENPVQKQTYNGRSPNYVEHLPPSSFAIYPVDNSNQLKRKSLSDKEQPNTKRAAVGVRLTHPYLKRTQEYQDSIHDPIPSSGNNTTHFSLNPTGPGLPHGRNSSIDETQRDLHAAEPNFDGRNSTTFCREHRIGPLLNNLDPKPPHAALPPISCLYGTGSERSTSKIHLQMLRSEHSSPSYPAKALQTSGNRDRIDVMSLLNSAELPEGTPSCIDTDAQRVDFAELSEGQYSMAVSQVSTSPIYLQDAPTLQGDSTVRIESSEKMNHDPVHHETIHQPTQTLDSEENSTELLVAPKPSSEKKVAEDWTGTSASRDLTKAVPMQPRKLVNDSLCRHSDTVARTTRDTFDRPSILRPELLAPTVSENSPKQDVLAFREGSSSEVYSQEATQTNLNQKKHRNPNLTDEQCRKIQEIVDPDGTRVQQSWEIKSQPQLIRLYMAGMSFPQIASNMEPEIRCSYKTYNNRFRDWRFPVTRIARENKIKQLYALLQEEGNSMDGSECATTPPFVSSEHAESWPTQTLGSEERSVPAKSEEKYTKVPPPEQDVPRSVFHNESNLRSGPETAPKNGRQRSKDFR